MARHVITDENMVTSPTTSSHSVRRHGKNDLQFIEAVCWTIRIGAP
ncbi:MAG: hypothetical protein Q8S21_06020 [Candidatus Paracaedibacteraceae bacterium]|nr:hypothetical protein [Candidatus Paracaedibacteraceae bacterium]